MREPEHVRRVDPSPRESQECAGTPGRTESGPRALRWIVLVPGRIHIQLGEPDRDTRRGRLDLRDPSFEARETAARRVPVEEPTIHLGLLPPAEGMDAPALG